MRIKVAIVIVGLTAAALALAGSAMGQSSTLYFQSPDGSINIIVSGGPGYIITPFPNGSGGYNGYTVTPSYPPPYAPQPASPYLGQPSPSYQYEYQRGGPAGCVYGCTGE